MRKEHTYSIGPGLFRIYSMRVKIRVPVTGHVFFQDDIPLTSLYINKLSSPQAETKMSVVLSIACHMSGCVGQARTSNTCQCSSHNKMQQWLNMQMSPSAPDVCSQTTPQAQSFQCWEIQNRQVQSTTSALPSHWMGLKVAYTSGLTPNWFLEDLRSSGRGQEEEVGVS